MSLAPNTENYLLGRGRIYFDRFDSQGQRTGWLDLGNAPDFSITISKETLEHFSSRSGIKAKDLEVVQQIASSFQFTLEEFSKENLALALLGEEASASQAGGSVTDESITAKHDRYVDLQYRKVSNVVVTGQGGTPTYVEGTDYVVDYEEGMIMALSSGSISDGAAILVDYDYGSLTAYDIRALKDASVDGALKFVGDPAQGPALVLEVWKCKLMPSGEIGLISDDWANFQLQAEAQKDEINHPNEPYFRVTHIDGGWS